MIFVILFSIFYNKRTIKPLKTEEVLPPIIREGSPELARISALVTRPPKPIKVETSKKKLFLTKNQN